MRFWQAGHSFQRSLGHSSPPTCMSFEGKSPRTSSRTFSTNSKVASFPAQSTSLDIPQWVPYFVSLSAASQSRICGQRPEHVPGHVDLGNHLDIALCGVGHDVADVVLGVETSVGSSVVAVTAFVGFVVSSDDGLFAYGPDLCQEGIPFDLDAPSLGPRRGASGIC